MLTHAEALAAIAAIAPLSLTATLPLARAHGAWLAADVRLDRDQPSFDRATMDGYALKLSGDIQLFTVRGTVFAGSAWTGPALQPGDAVRIMTGAPAPTGTTVVPVERTDAGLETVTITDAAALQPRRNIAWQGEDGRAGSTIVASGTRLTPATLAVAAMSGAASLTCWRPPTVAVVTTGDEVGGSGDAAIPDSNGPLLTSLLTALGIPPQRWHAGDTVDALESTLRAAALDADVVVTTGGISAGAKDLVPEVARGLGFATVFHHVAIQPGKPVFLARRDAPRGAASAVIGLPGNPVSVLATAHLYLLPLLGRFLGGWLPRWTALPLTVPWAHRGQRHLFLPARLVDGGVEPIRWNGSGDLIAAAAGDGLIELPVGLSGEPGARVRYLPYVGALPGEGGVCERPDLRT